MQQFILCADDYGYHPGVNQAILTLIKKQRLSATSCMVTIPGWSSAAAEIKPLADQVQLGLHLNLTEGAHAQGLLPLLALSQLRLLGEKKILQTINHQLDLFTDQMGKLPDYIDGHQHVLHLPVIRDAIIKIFHRINLEHHFYLRSVYQSTITSPGRFKKIVLQLTGAKAFQRQLMQEGIPHNPSFAGIYPFTHPVDYRELFQTFLADITEGGIIMCHPGLASNSDDPIATFRQNEYNYLISNNFTRDCSKHQRQLKV